MGEISVELDIPDENKQIIKWRTDNSEKILIFDNEKCVGCGICVIICPTVAIELMPVPEIATGNLEAPYCVFDHEKCIYCGLCAALCPVNAIEFTFNGESVLDMLDRLKLDKKIEFKEEKCFPCKLCELLCPRDAIEIDLQVPKKEELVIYPGEPLKVEGKIHINEQNCIYCMNCVLLCDAIEVDEVEPTSEYPKPGKNLRVNLDKCDFCGLCAHEKVCPVDVFKIECFSDVDRKILEPELKAEVKINEKECISCGWCQIHCPTEAIQVQKAIEGKLELTNMEKCDPVGCVACYQICPTRALYSPKSSNEKIIHKEEYCIYCGACELSCPEKLIKVDRESVKYTGDDTGPWTSSWLRAIEQIAGKQFPPVQIREIPLIIEEIKTKISKLKEIPTLKPEIEQRVKNKLLKINEKLKTIKTRFWVEGRTKKRIEIKEEGD
ncbi:MAG: 4Fe-4S binding protein [Promethearchaeota archaeon]